MNLTMDQFFIHVSENQFKKLNIKLPEIASGRTSELLPQSSWIEIRAGRFLVLLRKSFCWLFFHPLHGVFCFSL